MNDEYRTIEGSAEASFIEKKSEFIGQICHVETSDEAIGFINSVKAKHRKAMHNVYAYIVKDGNTSRYSDDGEPQGTAGVPVLDVLLKNEMTDICIVVTRYFGGILLGGGGLVRAYSHACKLALDAAVRKNMCLCSEFTIRCDYPVYGKISYILPEFGAKLCSENFADNVSLTVLVKQQSTAKFRDKIVDISNGRVEIKEETSLWRDFE